MKREFGNGSGKWNVHVDDRGGWLRVFSDTPGAAGDRLALALSESLVAWCRLHPQGRLRCVTPITRDGQTVELHAWLDVHVLPPVASSRAHRNPDDISDE